mgnify:CR=1 FL=1
MMETERKLREKTETLEKRTAQTRKDTEEMKEEKTWPKITSYSAAITVCEKGRQWKRVLQLLGEMGRTTMELDIVTFNAAMSACEKGLS